MIITTLIENKRGEHLGLCSEHGLSFLIEVYGKKIIFDTGQSMGFITNAAKLNKSLTDVDYVIISHAHYDHTGGIKELLCHLPKKVKFLMSQHFFVPKFKVDNGCYEYLGIDFDKSLLQEQGVSYELIEEETYKLSEDIFIMGNFEANPKPTPFVLQTDKGYEADLFKDELVLCIDTPKGLVVILGCSHPGLISILKTVVNRTGKKIRGIIGGTHLVAVDQSEYGRIIDELERFDLEFIGVSHCTGEEMSGVLEAHFRDIFFRNNTGTICEVN